MSKSEGQNKALTIAKEKLQDIDLNERLKFLGFKGFQNKLMRFKLFDNQVILNEEGLHLFKADSNELLRNDDAILFFHYLNHGAPVNQSDRYISFRELPGGLFYWNSFRARSVVPLVKRIGNDLALLEKNLARFDWEPQPGGDFGAKIHAIGNISILLNYQLGDDEFPPAATLSFSETIRRVYSAEDAAVMAGRICFGIL